MVCGSRRYNILEFERVHIIVRRFNCRGLMQEIVISDKYIHVFFFPIYLGLYLSCYFFLWNCESTILESELRFFLNFVMGKKSSKQFKTIIYR